MNDLDDLPPAAEPAPEPEFESDPVRWDQHRHSRRLRVALIIALLLAALTSLSMYMATDQVAHHHRSGAAATVRGPHDGVSGWSGGSES